MEYFSIHKEGKKIILTQKSGYLYKQLLGIALFLLVGFVFVWFLSKNDTDRSLLLFMLMLGTLLLIVFNVIPVVSKAIKKPKLIFDLDNSTVQYGNRNLSLSADTLLIARHKHDGEDYTFTNLILKTLNEEVPLIKVAFLSREKVMSTALSIQSFTGIKVQEEFEKP